MRKKHLFNLILFLFLSTCVTAQDKSNAVFGKVAASDFNLSASKFDTGANAIVIADIGSASFKGNNKGDLTLVFKRFTRIKILNRNGFDAAKVEINLYHDERDGEQLDEIKASTFNLESGQVTEAKLDSKSIFVDKLNKYYSAKKFTFPSVKEGSIIDLEYTIKSDYYNSLRSWSFQGDYPCLWSEYSVSIPQFFHYIGLSQGNDSFYIRKTVEDHASYVVRIPRGTEQDEELRISCAEYKTRWVKKDVPAIKEEPYITSLANYQSKIQFQLQYVQYSETGERHNVVNDWFQTSQKLLQDPNFGIALDNDNNWMSDETKSLTTNCKTTEEKARKIFAFIRDNFSCTDYSTKYAMNTLKSVYKARNGSVAEINLLLTAMLRHESIIADPVILSTRENGYTNSSFPIIHQFNYVICKAQVGDKFFLLDASQPKIGFNHLPLYCFNGEARTISKDKPYIVKLLSDSLKESSLTSVMIGYDEKAVLGGSFQSTPGYYGSYETREKVKKKTMQAFFKDIQTAYGSDLDISNAGIDSLEKLDGPVKLYYDFNLKQLGEDMIYFNPIVGERYRENPFKSAQRYYPVEMSYTIDDTYVLNMDIPKGYTVEELPKSARVAFNETEGSFEYLLQKDSASIQMRCRLKLNKTIFSPDEYNSLREFMGFVVTKENEQIVFKKISK